MPPKNRDISQNLLDDDYPRVRLQEDVPESKLTKESFDEFFEGYPSQRVVGLVPIYSSKGNLTQLAIAVKTRVNIIQFAAQGKGANAYRGREVLATELLCHPDVTLVAFDLDKLAVALFVDLNIRITNGVDLQSACGEDRSPLVAIKYAACDRIPVLEENVKNLFDSKNIIGQARTATNAALQAWVAQCIASMDVMEERVRSAKKITTKDRPDEHGMRTVMQNARPRHRAELLQAEDTAHEFTASGARNQTASVRANRFNSRFRKDTGMQRITIHDPETGLDFVSHGTVDSVNGRHATIITNASLEGRTVKSISTLGSNGPTNAERLHHTAVLQALQGADDYFQSPFLKYILQPSPDFQWPEDFPTTDSLPDLVSQRPLNDSQQEAVQHMLMNTEETRLTIIRGPPGTGKTTVIAAFVCSAVAAGHSGLWLMAQSNIAVKNIAEKLADVGFWDFRLLVSKDFHIGWHDHLYTSINKNIILSSQFKGARNRIHGVPVILCTLDMLAHPLIRTFTNANPITTAIIDEASQIPVGSYVTPFNSFSSSIKKVCMIGDDKQLPPFGAGEDPTIQSIFEIEHLKSDIKLLSIQYRMPPFIGDAISDGVYDGQLQSNPKHPVPVSTPSCWFVHVEDSEEHKFDTSWQNPEERAVVLKIAHKLQEEGKKYCIITPYDAQRTMIENEMKEAGLAWQEKCFNVDSFQGNEKDYIIVSLTRSKSLGFLDDPRRTNVMLTRCKRGMYIVTSWDFVHGVAAGTLVGMMSTAWGEEVWVNPEHLTVEVPK